LQTIRSYAIVTRRRCARNAAIALSMSSNLVFQLALDALKPVGARR
jgi:hypothetical protein